jgi:hypothetical protein
MMVVWELKPVEIGRDLAHLPFGVSERKDRSQGVQAYDALVASPMPRARRGRVSRSRWHCLEKAGGNR